MTASTANTFFTPETLSRLAASKPHGTRTRYRGGCRCEACRDALRRHNAERRELRKAGLPCPLVRTGLVLDHLHALRKAGVGKRAVHAACDVSTNVLDKILSGKRKTIRMRTALRILAVTSEAVSDGGLVDAAPVWKQVNELLYQGWTKRELALKLGFRYGKLQFGRTRVTARTALRIDRFYRANFFRGAR